MLSYLFCILADLYLFSYFPFVVTRVVTGRRATPSASEGIEDGAKVAIFSNFCDSFDVPVDALVYARHGRELMG